jgi:DNA-binding response OmpR family regulator
MEPLAVYPDPPDPDVVRALDLAGWTWAAVGSETTARDGVWSAAVVMLGDQPDAALAFARSIRAGDNVVAPVFLVVRGSQLAELDGRHSCFDDFVVSPFHPVEFETRLRTLLARGGMTESAGELIDYGALVLNTETYQALIDGRPLDLTYMEYQLLKFLVSSPGRVFTRETLLSQVWGYDYYGGARTVDVHIRRLRSKLGEEHQGLIRTVRSVGYTFGESRWAGSGPEIRPRAGESR